MSAPGIGLPGSLGAAALEGHTTVEEVVRAQLLKALGGWRGAVESAVPIIAFVAVWLWRDDLRTSLIAAGAVMALLIVLRLVQRQTLQHVFSGVVGLVIAAVVALRTGNAEDAFLPGILYNAGLAVVFGLSMIVRWPVVGLLFGSITGDPTGWRDRRDVMALFQRLTAVLFVPYVVRVAVQLPLYLAGQVALLGGAKLILGWPLLGAAVLLIGWLLAQGRTPLSEVVAAPAVGTDDQAGSAEA